MIFTGTYENKVDAKGRVSVPAAFRALIQGSKSAELAIFPSLRFDCLEAMSVDMLTALTRQMPKTSLLKKTRPTRFSQLLRSTQRFHIDDAGRITLPDSLIAKAGMDGKAVFTGDGYSFQIWSDAAHLAQLRQDELALAEMDEDE